MKKPLIIVGIIVVVGIAVWLAAPLFYTREANESLADIVGEMKVVTMDEMKKLEADKDKIIELPEAMEKKTEVKLAPQVENQLPSEPEAEPEPEPAEPMAVIAGQGGFEGLAGHNGSGKASLIKVGGKYYVRFEDDFRVTNGPDLYVDLGRDGAHDGTARLGRLKGSAGGQNYEVPAGIDVSAYNEVWVWCRAFSVPFAKAHWR